MNLSIIIPHYNRSSLLEILLKSIPKNHDIQTIVVDDKSDLFHLEVIKQLKKKYNFEFYKNGGIKGPGECRNIGLEKSKGKWILFADSDDYFFDGFYEKINRYFDTINDVVFFSPTSLFMDTGRKADRHLPIQKIIQNYLKDKSRKSELFLRYNFIAGWSKMIKKEFLINHNLKFDKTIGSEDVMLSTKIGHFMRHFEVSNDVIYCITVSYGSNSRILSENLFDLRLNSRVSRINFLNKNLSKKDLENIMTPLIINKAAELLLLSLRMFGLKKFLQVYKLYKKDNIKWFCIVYLNPIKIIKYIIAGTFKYIRNNRYNTS
jgi:glycosyltransferase involved in cell wall biosynthesis